MLQVKWQNRLDALEPVALAAFDRAAIRLARKLLSFDDEKLQTLHGVRARNLLLVAGKAVDLPWVDAAVYLGKDPAAPRVLLPTTRRPSVPIDLFERALVREFGDQNRFAAIENKIVLLGEMRSIARSVLQNWLLEKS